jgi:hypothetical protein
MPDECTVGVEFAFITYFPEALQALQFEASGTEG